MWAEGRIALVSGATSGIGAAVARRIHAGGGKVVAVGRRRERLEALVCELGRERISTLTLDLRDTAAIPDALSRRPASFKDIDIVFNNAGLALGLCSAQDADLQAWNDMIATNVSGLVAVTHALLPDMVARGSGDIVNMSSVAATYPYPGGNVYGATKAFVRQFSLNLRADLLGTGLRVTSIEPGMCETEFSLVRFGGDAAGAGKVYAGMTPLSAEDVAASVEFVLRQARHVNINTIELMPTQQTFSPFTVDRNLI
ncbi:MAG: oxidoreductase [Blastomonas sp. CACIA14H2]|uniref:SDR family NAD(P)-dependent oxidoreductase n=1 Tax=Blastomonas sp. CACIA14H2 TaxID=1419876 RepID=UPI0003D010F0|nr:MAG: oxidoreductase [Blastomonas sp. CACIA14H2]